MSSKNGSVRFGEFIFDGEKLLFTSQGRPVPLTPKASELLCVLIENRGQIVTKDKLMQRVWSDSFVEEGNLPYTIRLLRKALGDDANAPVYIESIPRRGYRFIANCLEAATPDPPPAPAETDYGALVGRDTAISELRKLLGGERRLVTLTGTGGTGKTRLAREMAVRTADIFPDGIQFVELAALDNPELVAPAIARGLRIKDVATKDVLDAVSDHLQGKRMLLILDNFEQIISAGATVAAILRRVPELKILVTSREPLKLSFEKEYRVPPLELPSSGTARTIDVLMRAGAGQLFIVRAKAARDGVEFADEDAPTIALICEKLDGLPLALELAASRAKVLPVSQILDKLADRLALLTGGSRDAPDRHQTVRAAIGWSYDLLNDTEKLIFVTLSVFEGSFTFEAAERVFQNIEGNRGYSKTQIVDSITSLTEKGLLVSDYSADGVYFRMLVVVRDYGLELVRDRDNAIRLAHAQYYLHFVETASPYLFLFHSPKWLDRFDTSRDNIRAAIRWSLDNAPHMAARMLAGVRHLAGIRWHTREIRYWLEEALNRSADIPLHLHCEILTGLGVVCQYQLDYTVGRRAHESTLELSRKLADERLIARALRGLAAIDYMELDLDASRARTTEALEISRSIKDEFGEAAALSRLGDICNAEHDHTTAGNLIKQSLEIFTRIGYRQGISSKHVNLSITRFCSGDHVGTRMHLAKAITASTEIGDQIDFRVIFEIAAALMVEAGDLETAARLSGAAEALCEEIAYYHEPVEQRFRDTYFNKLKALMGPAEFDEAYSKGRTMTMDEAVDLARQCAAGAAGKKPRSQLVRPSGH